MAHEPAAERTAMPVSPSADAAVGTGTTGVEVASARTVRSRAIAVAIAVAAAILAAWTTSTSLAWIGRSFPGFVFLPNRLIATISLPHWAAAELKDIYWHQIVAVDGQTVSSAREIEEKTARLAPGTAVRFDLVRGDERRSVSTLTQRFDRYDWTMLFGAYLFDGVVFLGSGLLAWVLRPNSSLTRAFLAFGANSALFLFTAMDLYGPGTFGDLHQLSEALLPATALQLLLVFPHEHRLARWRFAGYPMALLLFAAIEASLDRPLAFAAANHVSYLLTATVGLLFGVRCILEYHRARSALARQRIRVATLATLAGMSVPGLIFLSSLAMGGGIGMNTIAFAFFAFPIGLSYAIVKHDFLAIDAMVKRGAYYLVLTGALGITYAIAVFVLDWALRGTGFADSPVFAVVFTVAVLVLFNPLRTRLQSLIDRTFFRSTYDAAKAFADLGARLASARNHDEVAHLVRDAIDGVIPNAGTLVFLDRDGSDDLRDEARDLALPAMLYPPLAAERIVTSEDPPEAYADPARREAVLAAMRSLDACIAVPMLLQGRLVGVVAPGAKRSGLFFTGGDAEFLRALAHEAAIAVGKASASEALERIQSDQLDRARRTAVEPLLLPSKFELLGRIGQGGMGIVFKARHVTLETVVAVKVLPDALARDPEFVQRFHREARVMAQLRHPNVVRVLDIDVEGSVHFFVMEYIAGRSLAEIVRTQGPLPLSQVIDVSLQVGAALAYAHAHDPPVVHRDVTPSNVLLEEATGRAVVTDFGIAKVAEARAGLTRTGDFFGKMGYSSPEQIRGERDVDGRADVYSLGLVMHELFSGRHMFAGMTENQVMRRVAFEPGELAIDFGRVAPAGFREIVARAVAKDPGQRYQSALELIAALESLRASSTAPLPSRVDSQEASPAATPEPSSGPLDAETRRPPASRPAR